MSNFAPGTFPLKQSDGKGPGRCWYRYGFVTCVDHAITWRPCRAICMLKAKYITGSMAECKRSFGVCIFGSLIWGTVVQSFDIQQDKEFICVFDLRKWFWYFIVFFLVNWYFIVENSRLMAKMYISWNYSPMLNWNSYTKECNLGCIYYVLLH